MTTESDGSDRPPTLSRRAVLTGAAGTSLAGLIVLTGCGGSSGTASTAGGGTTTEPVARLGNAPKDGKVLVARFDSGPPAYVLTGTEQRLCFGLGGPQGEIINDGPDSLDMALTKDGRPVGGPITVPKHKVGIPTAYYPMRITFDAPGIYRVTTTLDGRTADQSFTVAAPTPKDVPGRGARLKPFDTPTTAENRGVEPICTRKPDPCPFHAVTLTEALAKGGPVGFIVSTPEFCQSAVCGPVLELVTAAAKDFPTYTFVHAEVYKDAAARGDFQKAEIAPAVSAFGLTFEPTLFVADPSGTIIDRLDNVFDDAELRAALKKAAGT